MNFPKSCKVVHLVPLSRHELYINQEMPSALLWKVQNCYFLAVLLQQPCSSEYSTESSYPEVLEKHLLKYQHDCE